MKKLTLSLFCALVAFGAHAITYNWTTEIKSSSSKGHNDHGEDLHLQANRSATVGAQITYGSSIGSGSILSLGKEGFIFRAVINSEGNYALQVVKGSNVSTIECTTTISATANETQIVTLAFYRKTGYQMGAVEMAVNGVVVATLANSDITYGPLNRIGWGQSYNDTDNPYTGDATYSVWYLSGGSGTDNKLSAADAYKEIQGLSAPEPTALALLALGIAGVALKRKIAQKPFHSK